MYLTDELKDVLPPNIIQALNEVDPTCLKQLILKNNVRDIQQVTKLTLNEVHELIFLISEKILYKRLVAVSEIEKTATFTTGCKSIDRLLNGGIPFNGINEIYGSSGVGKTQICLQLSLTIQLSTRKGVVYICTEDAFPSQRLYNLIKIFPLCLVELDIDFGDNILIDHVADYEQFKLCLYTKLPKLLNHRSIGLIIVDSIAGLFRSENENVCYVKRSKDFLTIASKLNKLGQEHQIATVCVNQVTDNINTGESVPCLGLAWRNLVTNRFYISRCTDKIRKFEVIFSPFLHSSSCNFIIKNEGIVDIS